MQIAEIMSSDTTAWLLEKVAEHWLTALLAVVGALITSTVVAWRAGRRWRQRDFLDRVNFSLTFIEGGVLRIRTLAETNCDAVFLNTRASACVQRAALKTTPNNVVLPLPLDDYWPYLNAALNEVSERFAEGNLRRAAGLPVRTVGYWLCLTSEPDNVRTKKVRAMIIEDGLLRALPAEMPNLESPHHARRWKTLQQLAARVESHPHEFIGLELCFAVTQDQEVSAAQRRVAIDLK